MQYANRVASAIEVGKLASKKTLVFEAFASDTQYHTFAVIFFISLTLFFSSFLLFEPAYSPPWRGKEEEERLLRRGTGEGGNGRRKKKKKR